MGDPAVPLEAIQASCSVCGRCGLRLRSWAPAPVVVIKRMLIQPFGLVGGLPPTHPTYVARSDAGVGPKTTLQIARQGPGLAKPWKLSKHDGVSRPSPKRPPLNDSEQAYGHHRARAEGVGLNCPS